MKKEKSIEYLNNELSKDANVGKFIGNERGFGFVEIDGKDGDIFIPPDGVNGAMHGDTVFVKIDKDENEKKRKEGHIAEVLERYQKEVVGTYAKGKDFGFVIADDKHIFQDIYIAKKERKKAKNGDKVVVSILKYPTKDKKAEGRIIEILGKAEDENTDLISIVRTYGYKLEFSKEVKKEAKEIPQEINLNDSKYNLFKDRVDLRDKEIFTIDGADTKDIDDAISLDYKNGKYILGVHIADVSNYVVDDSELDREARRRGTSVYLINSVIPMLPKELSNGICSLNENEDRYALSIDITLDKNAEIMSSNIYKSVIRSKKKMTYDDVYKIVGDEFENNRVIPDGYEPFANSLLKMKELALKLQAKRHKQGAIDFDLPEPKIILDDNDEVLSIKPYETTIANQMIEQFMVLANECIAKTFFEKKIPFIYRVHEIPNKDKLDKLRILLKNLNYKDEISKEVKPIEIQKIIEESKGKPEEKVVATIALRSMQLARYTNENLGHFGLALENYCHFTSPIRRYPDLFIHRVISNYLNNNLDDKLKSKFLKQAIKYSETSSEMERLSEEAERELNTIKMCEYMNNHIGEEFDGIISGINNYGIFVELDNTIEGMVHVENMKDDYYNYDEMNCAMIGERTHKVYKIGDSVKVKVLSANKMLRRIDFEIV